MAALAVERIDRALTAEALAERVELVTAPEVATRLRVSRMTVQDWVTRKENPLPCIETPSGIRVFLWSDVERFMRDRKP